MCSEAKKKTWSLKICIGKKRQVKNIRVKEISHIEKTPDDLCGLGLIGVESNNEKNLEISFYTLIGNVNIFSKL